MASLFGWYGPLIDLSTAPRHIGEFVQLLVFVHRCFPVQVSFSFTLFTHLVPPFLILLLFAVQIIQNRKRTNSNRHSSRRWYDAVFWCLSLADSNGVYGFSRRCRFVTEYVIQFRLLWEFWNWFQCVMISINININIVFWNVFRFYDY
jgi:hypothetical protein